MKNCLLCGKPIPEKSGHEVEFSTNVTFPELQYEDGRCHVLERVGDRKVCHTCHEEQRMFMLDEGSEEISLMDILHGRKKDEEV